MKAIIHWTASNVALLLLALTLAVLAWIVAIEEEDPTIEDTYPQEIPILLQELPEGLIIVGEFDQTVQVTIRAPESVWNVITPEDFTVTVDLAGLDAGESRVPVQVALDRTPSRVMRFEPERLTLRLEARAERTVPVQVLVDGELPLGHVRRTPEVEPAEVTISGPSSYVTQVTTVAARVSIEDATSDVEGDYPLRPLDDDGNVVPNVDLSSDETSVLVPIELSGYYRSLAVKSVLEGDIAPGYFNPSISIDPPTVMVFGNPSVLNALPGFIETEPIDVEGAQSDVVVRPALSVPAGVAIVSGQQVEVAITIEAIQSSLAKEIVPEVQGLEPGLTVTVSLESVEVLLSGPLPLLETLEPDDVRVVLDLFGLTTGTHQIEPEVVVPSGVTAQSVQPPTIQVEISTGTSRQLGDD